MSPHAGGRGHVDPTRISFAMLGRHADPHAFAIVELVALAVPGLRWLSHVSSG